MALAIRVSLYKKFNYLTNKTDENSFLYTQQRNKCVALLRNTKKNYYENLDEKDWTDKKNRNNVKP